MKQLSDYMVISDMDGTLLGEDGKIPARNLEAIERFVAKGGRFGIATGRSQGLMLEMAKGLPINAPCVLYNGGAVYDFAADKKLLELHLPQNADAYIRRIMATVPPNIGVMIISGDSYHQVKEERSFAEFYDQRGSEHFYKSIIKEVARPWYKALFQVLPEQFDDFFAALAGQNFPGVRFVATNTTLIEMLPEESSKGYALQKIIDQGLVRRENLVAIGDYYNDLEMIELAGIGVTLETSPAEIRARADLVVGGCAHGAVADLIEHLERLCTNE